MNEESLEIKQYLPEDFIKLCGGDEASVAHARLNQVAGAGLARSIYYEDELIACGGIRKLGVGEGWMKLTPKALEDKRLLLRKGRELFDLLMEEGNMWRVYAETKSDDPALKNFLEHMGYQEKTLFLR